MSFFDRAKREFKAILFILCLTVSGAVLIVLSQMVNGDVGSVSESWRRFNTERSEKAEVVTALRKTLGYGGMIHQFKNFILRSDPVDFQHIHEGLGAAEAAISRYRSLGANQAENAALNDLRLTLQAYRNASNTAFSLVERKSSVANVDQLVKVDDGPALTALDTLLQEARLGMRKNNNPMSKGAAIDALRATIGYGGMIHEFKNFVLRGGKDRISRVKSSIENGKHTLDIYAVHSLNGKEEAALAGLRSVLGAYGHAIKVAQQLKEQGEVPTNIDKTVRVDDKPAFRAFAILDRQRQLQHDIRAEEVSATLAVISQLVQAGFWITLVLMLGLVVGGVWGLLDRRRQDQDLKNSEARFSAIVDNTLDGSIVIDSMGVITEFNKSASVIFGYSPTEVIGKNVRTLMPNPDAAQHDNYIQNFKETGAPKIVGKGRDIIGLRKNGEEFPLRLGVSRMIVGGEPSFIGAITDLTELKSLERQLRQSQRMEAVGQLTGGIAHDFNNLLFIMTGNAELVGDSIGGNEKACRQLDAIKSAVKRGAALTSRLLSFSRQQTLSPIAGDVSALIDGLEDMLHRTLGEAVEL
jgi:PAS domain S-box-containing protein